MLTRRTFIQSTGALAAAAAGGMAITEPEIKEHGIVEIRFWFLAKDPHVVKSTIFSDERRGVFGVRILGERGSSDLRMAELRLSAVKAAVAFPGRVQKCAMTGWNTERAKKEEGFLDLVAKGGNLVVALPGQLAWSPPPGPVWLALSDVRQVL